MKQIMQNLGDGTTQLIETPAPALKDRHIRIQTVSSLISAGTEKMLIDFGKAGYLEKARQQPEKVKMVLDKIRTDGILPTINAVRSKLDNPIPIGYCNVGVVDSGDTGVFEGKLQKGDRVVSNGPHAQFVCVPKNLIAKIPDKVSDDEASFTVPGAIALQGVRLVQPMIGETFAIIGLGLLGQLTAQILRANGCNIIGIDYDKRKCDLLQRLGGVAVCLSENVDPVDFAKVFTAGNGVDGVAITAATKSSEPVSQAAQMCRKRGRIVLVGVTGLKLHRSDFYEKELTFQVSCSYGPGRYDIQYETKGHDYPFGYVRWTEQRNFEAVLSLMDTGRIDVNPLISHRFDFEDALKAYDLIYENSEPYLGVVLNFPDVKRSSHEDHCRPIFLNPMKCLQKSKVCIGVIGAGNYTGQILLPALKKNNSKLKIIASETGISGTHIGKKFGFNKSTTEPDLIFSDPDINAVIVASRHDSHAEYVIKALSQNKHVFVEKPLCLSLEELSEIKRFLEQRKNVHTPFLMVGFNRRFSPYITQIKTMLSKSNNPKSFIMTVNAGEIPADHWTQDVEIGGGRIIGEACHFIDLLRFLAGYKIIESRIFNMDSLMNDTASIQLAFEDGSIGTIHYFANGPRSYPKERLEVFDGGRIIQLNNFKQIKLYGWQNYKKKRLWRQDKGHANCIKCFVACVTGGENVPPIPYDEIFEVTKISIDLSC